MNRYAITAEDAVQNATPVVPGIHENVKFQGFDFRSITEEGDPVLIADFQLETGSIFGAILWDVDEARERASAPNRVHPRSVKSKGYVKGEPMTGEDAIDLAYELFRSKVRHITSMFIEQERVEEATKSASSYQTFAEALKNLFTEEILSAGPTLRMKISPNTKGYAVLPTYPPFVEPMTVSKSTLKFNSYEASLLEQESASDVETEEVPF